MPPAFNLSQDQTLQFNLCYLFPFLEFVLSNESLTQNTDSSDSIAEIRLALFLVKHLIFFKHANQLN